MAFLMRLMILGTIICGVIGIAPVSISQDTSELPLYPKIVVLQSNIVATVYHADLKQTDGTPFITADGTDVRKQGYRVLSVSRNLLKRHGGVVAFGDTVWISGTGRFDGCWVVRDTLHPRFKNRIDFLVSSKIKTGKWHGVIISKMVRVKEEGK